MPTRMIREGLLDSTKYANVSDAARLLFIHLMLLADDLGCVSVGSTFLRRRCFYDSPSDERISRILMELVDVGLIRTYEVDRSCYAFIPKFRQRLKRATLKHPQPPESVYQDDDDAKEKFREINQDSPKKAAVGPPAGRPRAPEEKRREEKNYSCANDFAQFWEAYPKKRSKGDALKAWKQLKPDDQLLQLMLLAISRARTSADWLKNSGQYVPHPASWLRARGWEDEYEPSGGRPRNVVTAPPVDHVGTAGGRVSGLAELRKALEK